MNLLFICPRWGSEALEPEAFVARVREAAYDGIELSATDPDPVVERVVSLARDAGLQLILQHWDIQTRDLGAHLKQFEARLRYAASFKPMFTNSHTGRNLFTLEQNREVFSCAARVAADTGVPVVHETHRGRCCHTAWRTVELLRAEPSVRIALDMSHWCCVSESLLEDQTDFVEAVVPHVDHIHARVGWAHGPQVSDPRAPEWESALEAHLKWWDRCVAHKRAVGADRLTIAPEFGPPPYLPVLPFTREPVASQWDINVHMMNLLRARYAG
ncbi:MAG TPA: TIM barrel protein [Kiritimatiellia bacterium]|nr:TIM barrel protein [Kiritimatiellia bacterium]